MQRGSNGGPFAAEADVGVARFSCGSGCSVNDGDTNSTRIVEIGVSRLQTTIFARPLFEFRGSSGGIVFAQYSASTVPHVTVTMHKKALDAFRSNSIMSPVPCVDTGCQARQSPKTCSIVRSRG